MNDLRHCAYKTGKLTNEMFLHTVKQYVSACTLPYENAI